MSAASIVFLPGGGGFPASLAEKQVKVDHTASVLPLDAWDIDFANKCVCTRVTALLDSFPRGGVLRGFGWTGGHSTGLLL